MRRAAMRRQRLEQQLFMPLSGVRVSARERARERRQRSRRLPACNVLGQRLANDRRGRFSLAAGMELEVTLECFRDEDCRAFHMTYDNIYNFLTALQLANLRT